MTNGIPETFSEGNESGRSTRAAIYCRTSSPSQQFGYSIDEQARQCFQQCKYRNWKVVFLFTDEAESGDDVERPMFQRMMKAAEQGLFDVVVVWKLDRFSRSLLQAVKLESELRELGVGLHSVTEQIDTTTSAGRFNFRNIANAAEFEREMIKERSQMGLKALAEDGKWPNDHPPLGYQKVESGDLTIDSSERELVEEIFEHYLQTESMAQVAHELNQRGVTTKKGTNWTARGVGEILKNELYIGVYTVAGVSKFIPEYQIINPNCFWSVIQKRRRYRSSSKTEQEKMDRSRKGSIVEGVIEEYSEFVENDHN